MGTQRSLLEEIGFIRHPVGSHNGKVTLHCPKTFPIRLIFMPIIMKERLWHEI